MKLLKIFLLLNILPAFANKAFATISENEEISKAISQTSTDINYFGMFFGLFFVIALVYLTAFIYQKLLKVKIAQNNTNNHIEILSTTSLGQGKNLHIIKVNNELSLIGSTQNNITLIKELKDNLNDTENKNEQNN